MNIVAGQLPEGIYMNILLSWKAVLQRKCITVVERKSKVISKWLVHSYYFSLFFFSALLSS